jgi:hypothetical protein
MITSVAVVPAFVPPFHWEIFFFLEELSSDINSLGCVKSPYCKTRMSVLAPKKRELKECSETQYRTEGVKQPMEISSCEIILNYPGILNKRHIETKLNLNKKIISWYLHLDLRKLNL